jgi:hypothetical protein
MIRYIDSQSALDALLADVAGGWTAVLVGAYRTVTIRNAYERPITVYAATASTVNGLVISGANVNWHGGLVVAPGGSRGSGPAGYGVSVQPSARSIAIDGVRVRDADRGFVTNGGNGIRITNCDVSVRQDGIIASGTKQFDIIDNRFHAFYPLPTTCTIGSDVRTGLSRRDCEAVGGVWRDGDHSDGIQLRNGITDCRIVGNRIESITQGICQMDTTGDAPLSNVLIAYNNVEVTGFHSITFGRCANLSVIGNRTKQMTNRRSPLRLPPDAIQRENEVLSP